MNEIKIYNKGYGMSYFKKAFALMAVVAISTTDLFAYNVTIGDGGTACPAVSGDTITATEDCSISVETIQTALASGTLAINTGNTGGDGNIYVNSEIEWSTTNTLNLIARNNIYINKSITATNDNGKLALFYGQGAVNADNTSDYYVNAPINLKAGDNFITILGSNGAITTWTVVTTASDLQAIALDGNSVLGADVDASGIVNWTPIGDSSSDIFKGNFDGLGHVVDNLTINNSHLNTAGLFGYTSGATIKNIGLTNVNISASGEIGGLVGQAYTSKIKNVFVEGAITGATNRNIGGLVGHSFNSNIDNSYAKADIVISNNSGTNQSVGGLVGDNYHADSKIKNSYSSGTITLNTNSNSTASIGGLAGKNIGTITNSWYDNETNTQTMADSTTYGKTKAEILTALSSQDAWTAGSASGDASVEGYLAVTPLTLPQLVAFYTSSGEILFAGGFGTEADPYEITNWNQLQNINHSNILTQGYYYSLLNDLGSTTDGYTTQVKDGETLANSGKGWNPIGSQYSTFTGNFDGLGHTVDALTIDNSTSSYQGLFGAVKTGSNIKNVGATNVNIKGKIRVGALAGNNQGNISNAYSTGTVVGTGAFAGGLIGRNSGSVENSYSLAAATSAIQIGGLVGQNTGTISNSYASSSVASSSNSDTVGGLTNNFQGTVTNSYYDNETNTATMADSDTYGKTTAELKNLALDNWDIETYTATENTYPTLAWEESGNTYTKTWIIGQKSLIDINISNNTLAENNSADAIIGTLSTINSDTGDTFTYSLCGGVDDASFSITTNELQANAVFDYESKNSYEVCVRTTDSGSVTFDKNITIFITNVNEMPSISSTATTSVDEESAYSYTLGASDADGDSLTWSVKSGTNLPSWLELNTTTIPSSVTTLVDSGLIYPYGVAVDSSGNIYIADTSNNAIKKIDTSGNVATLVDSGLSSPSGVAVDSSGNIYIADTYNHTIKKRDTSGDVTTLVSGLNFPYGVAVDNSGNIYIADVGNNAIKKRDTNGTVTTLVDSGLDQPYGVAVDSSGNIYIADTQNHAIKKRDTSGNVTTLLDSNLNRPYSVAVDSSGNIYIADNRNNAIKKIDTSGNVTTLVDSGLNKPARVAVDSSGNIYIADTNNNAIKKYTPPITTTKLTGTPTNDDVGEHNISLVVSDGTNETEYNFTITVSNTNDTPTNISISANTLPENSTIGTIIADLNTTDIDVVDTHTYSFCGGTNDGNFTISGSELKSNAIFDYETTTSQIVCIRTTDSGSVTFDKNITITITNIDESVAGVCGTADVSIFESAPTTGLCNKGTTTAVTKSGDNFVWSCKGTTVGSNTGTDANCDAGVQSSNDDDNSNNSGDSGTNTGSDDDTNTGSGTDTTTIKVVSIPDILVDINSSKFVEINGTQTNEHNLSQYFKNTTSYSYVKKDTNTTVQWLNLNSITGDINLTTNIVENNTSLVDTKHYIKITGLNSDTNISTYFTIRFKDLNASLSNSITSDGNTTSGTTEDGVKYSTVTKGDSNATVYSNGITKYTIKDKAEAISQLADSKLVQSENGDLNITASTINNSGEIIDIEVLGFTSGDTKAQHILKLEDGNITQAISKVANTTTTVKEDRSVETNATINSNKVSVVANPDGTAQHILSVGDKISKAISKIKGATTTITNTGIDTQVDFNNTTYLISTDKDGETVPSKNNFKLIDTDNGDKLSVGSTVTVNTDGTMEINTTIPSNGLIVINVNENEEN